jgi:hypothetical protein
MNAHEHFCASCYSSGKTRGVTRGVSGRGWWQCTVAHCPRPTAVPCRMHVAESAMKQIGKQEPTR